MTGEGQDGRVQEGQMAVAGVVGQEVGGGAGGPDSRGVGAGGGWQGTRWGRNSGGKEGQMVDKGGDGRVQESQMAVSVGCGAGGEMAGSQMG